VTLELEKRRAVDVFFGQVSSRTARFLADKGDASSGDRSWQVAAKDDVGEKFKASHDKVLSRDKINGVQMFLSILFRNGAWWGRAVLSRAATETDGTSDIVEVQK
jgi:hypothetical protein